MQDDDLSRFEAEGAAPLPVTDVQGKAIFGREARLTDHWRQRQLQKLLHRSPMTS